MRVSVRNGSGRSTKLQDKVVHVLRHTSEAVKTHSRLLQQQNSRHRWPLRGLTRGLGYFTKKTLQLLVNKKVIQFSGLHNTKVRILYMHVLRVKFIST